MPGKTHKKVTCTVRACYLLAGIFLLFSCGCSALLFHPERQQTPNPLAERFSPQDVYFESDDETLHGWFFRAENPKGTVLVFHGNAGNITTHVNTVLWLVQEGFNLFAIDYRGFGNSSGEPDVAGVHHDGLAAFKQLLTLPGVSSTRIAVLGQSLGGSVATYVAATAPKREKVKLLLLDSSFFSYQQITREKLAKFFITWPLQYPLSWLFNNDYSPAFLIDRVTAPIVIIHDRADTVVPFHHGGQLYAASREPKTMLTTSGLGHIGSFADAGLRNRVAALIAGSLPVK